MGDSYASGCLRCFLALILQWQKSPCISQIKLAHNNELLSLIKKYVPGLCAVWMDVCMNQINSKISVLLCLSQFLCFFLSLFIASHPSSALCDDAIYSYNSSNLSVLAVFCKGDGVKGTRSCHSASWFVCQCGGGTTVFDQHHPRHVSGWH